MSLHKVAHHLKDQGRGPDDQLIHMSSKEIAGLQALAQAHGTSLTVNPKTGLPEAGALDSLLPAIIGAGLALAFPEIGILGLSAPATIGLGIGAEETARTGDLGKGALAGLGAFGGAGVAGGLAAAGGNAATAYGNAAGMTDAAAQKLGFDSAEAYAQTQAAQAANLATAAPSEQALAGAKSFVANPTMAGLGGGAALTAAAAPTVYDALKPNPVTPQEAKSQMIRPYTFSYNKKNVPEPPQSAQIGSVYRPGQDTSERLWFEPTFTAQTPYKAADGGLMSLAAGGGPVERMSNNDAIGANTMYPMANMTTSAFATPYQTPMPTSVLAQSGGASVDPETGELNPQGTRLAGGGIAHLGSYSDGGRLLRGPGDGVSDSIPAQIGDHQPARLADGEFVVPARIVSELGNGSTEAGARQLYKMMARVQNARAKTTGKNKVAKNTNAAQYLPV